MTAPEVLAMLQRIEARGKHETAHRTKQRISAACVLKLAAYVFVRPGALRFAEWREFDLDGAERRIPAEKMKTDGYHLAFTSRSLAVEMQETSPSALHLGQRSCSCSEYGPTR